MKKFILSLSFIITGLLCAQPSSDPMGGTSPVQPPNIVITTFTLNYPSTRAAWSTNDFDHTYCAQYRDETTNMGRIIVYDRLGNLVAVENELHNNAYPAAIALYYIKNFPKEKFTIWSYYDTNDSKVYFASRADDTVWFDRNGQYTHIIKKKFQLITKKS